MRRFIAAMSLFVLMVAYHPATASARLDQSQLNRGEEQLLDALPQVTSWSIPSPLMQTGKVHACLQGDFVVSDNLPNEFQYGIFQPGRRYSVIGRFASTSAWDDREKDVYGLSLKLFGTPGDSLLGPAGVSDFVLASHPVLFVANPNHLMSYSNAVRAKRAWRYWLDPRHWYSWRILVQQRRRINSVLEVDYFSATPYRLGEHTDQAVKYSVSPCGSKPVMGFDSRDKDFLLANIERHLESASVCLNFAVQMQADPASMPIENTARRWSAQQSPFRPIGTIVFTTPKESGNHPFVACDNFDFNPWRVSGDHRPLGSINRLLKMH